MYSKSKREISVCNQTFLAEGYSEFPVEPFRFEKIIDEEDAYLVDANGDVWYLSNGCFTTSCLYLCLNVIKRIDPDFRNHLFSQMMYEIGVEDVRARIYDEEQMKG